MTKAPSRRPTLAVSAALLCFGVLVVGHLLFLSRANARQSCTNPDPHASGQKAVWAQDASVTVNINPDQFSSAERACVQRAFDNWTAANGSAGNASGVRFNVQPPSTMPVAVVDSQGNVTGGHERLSG